MRRGDQFMGADQITFDKEADRYTAEGSIRYQGSGLRMVAARAEGNQGTETHVIHDLDYQLLSRRGNGGADSVTLAGEMGTLRGATYSTCPPDARQSGAARPPDRHRHRGRHGRRARRRPAGGQGPRAVHALVHVSHRRAASHRPAVPVDLEFQPQWLRLPAADLPEPGAELRRHPQPTPDDGTRRPVGRAVPLPGGRRARRGRRHLDAGRQVARSRPQPAPL